MDNFSDCFEHRKILQNREVKMGRGIPLFLAQKTPQYKEK